MSSSPTIQRAWYSLHVKAVDVEHRLITGIATTPEPDRLGDIIEPRGVKFRNPLPLLLFHDHTRPVGTVKFDKATDDGITFEASIPDITEPGTLKDRIDEAWQSVKAKLVRGVSIGFRVLDDGIELLKTGGVRFTKTEVLELSLVTVPANQSAQIHSIKSIDVEHLAASGNTGVTSHAAGVTASSRVVSLTRKDSRTAMAKTVTEQISAFEAKRAATTARMSELQEKAIGEGRTKDVSEKEEFDTLSAEIKSIDSELVDLREMEKLNISKAVPVAGRTPEDAAVTRNGISVIALKRELPKGTLFTRYAMAVAAGKGSISDTIAFAKRWDEQTPEVSAYIIRKAVEGTSVDNGSPSWGSQLVYQQNLASEFVDLLRPATILGRITGIRPVPPNVRIAVQTGGSTVNWVGEAAPKPVSELSFDTITLGYDKIAGIVVLTEELVRLSSPSAEEAVRRDLVEQISRFMDAQFIDPTVTAGANNPASITNGVASPAASGTDADALYVDLNTALATFDNTDIGTNSIVIIMTPALARGISTLRNALGQFEFSSVNMAGGTLLGFPVIVSSAVPSGTIIILKADEIFMADDGRVTLDASNQATLDMNGGTAPDFNLWQRNCIAIRAERWITWRKRRADAVAIIDTASYGPSVGSP